MKATKIDWCDCTVNPVVGCPNSCEYCYGRVLNDRFHFVPDWDKPEFFPDRLGQFEGVTTRAKSIFIDSMSDIGCWNYEWFKATMDASQGNLKHNYIALTKRPERLLKMRNKYAFDIGKTLKNTFLGATVTSGVLLNEAYYLMDFLSIEPLLGPLNPDALYELLRQSYIKVLIVGAETGRRAGKVIPERKWVDDIVCAADRYGTPIFMKGSLRALMGDDFRQDRLPWEVK